MAAKRWVALVGLAGCIHYVGGEDQRRNETAPPRAERPPLPVPLETVPDTPPPGLADSAPSPLPPQPITSLQEGAAGRTKGWIGLGLAGVFAMGGSAPSPGSANGVPIQVVFDGSPAHQAGIHAGDILTAVNGTPVLDAFQASQLLHQLPAGRSARVDYRRAGVDQQASVTPVPRPAETMSSFVSVDGSTQPMTEDAKRQLILQVLSQAGSACTELEKAAADHPDDAVAKERADLCRKQIELTREELRLDLQQMKSKQGTAP